MNRPDDLRKNAENCVALAEIADSGPKKRRYARMATAWNCLADTQAWLGPIENQDLRLGCDSSFRWNDSY